MSNLEKEVKKIKKLYERFRESAGAVAELRRKMERDVSWEIDDALQRGNAEDLERVREYYQKIQEDIEKFDNDVLQKHNLLNAKDELLESIQEVNNERDSLQIEESQISEDKSLSDIAENYKRTNSEDSVTLGSGSRSRQNTTYSSDNTNDSTSNSDSTGEDYRSANADSIFMVDDNMSYRTADTTDNNSFMEESQQQFLEESSIDQALNSKKRINSAKISNTKSRLTTKSNVKNGNISKDSGKSSIVSGAEGQFSKDKKELKQDAHEGFDRDAITKKMLDLYNQQDDLSDIEDTIQDNENVKSLNTEFLLTLQSILRNIHDKQNGVFDGKESDYNSVCKKISKQLSELEKYFTKNDILKNNPRNFVTKVQKLFKNFLKQDEKLDKIRRKKSPINDVNQLTNDLYQEITSEIKNIYKDYVLENSAFIDNNLITDDMLAKELNNVKQHRKKSLNSKKRSNSEKISNMQSRLTTQSNAKDMNIDNNRLRSQALKKSRNSMKSLSDNIEKFDAYQNFVDSGKLDNRPKRQEGEYFSIGEKITEMYRESIVVPDLKEEYQALQNFFQNHKDGHDVKFQKIDDLMNSKSNNKTIENIVSSMNKIKADHPTIYKEYTKSPKNFSNIKERIEIFNTKSKDLLNQIEKDDGLNPVEWKENSFTIYNDNEEPVVDLTRKIQSASITNSQGKKVKVNSYETLTVPDKVKDTLHLFLPGATSDGKKLSNDNISGLKVSVHYAKDGNVEELVMPKGIFFDKKMGNESPALIEKDGVLVTFPIKLKDYNAIQRKLGRDEYRHKEEGISYSTSRGNEIYDIEKNLTRENKDTESIIRNSMKDIKISNLTIPRTPKVVPRRVSHRISKKGPGLV